MEDPFICADCSRYFECWHRSKRELCAALHVHHVRPDDFVRGHGGSRVRASTQTAKQAETVSVHWISMAAPDLYRADRGVGYQCAGRTSAGIARGYGADGDRIAGISLLEKSGPKRVRCCADGGVQDVSGRSDP